MAPRNERRVVEITVDARQFQRQLNKVNRQLNGLRAQVGRLHDSFRNLFGTLGAGFAGFVAVQSLRDFIRDMAEIERLDNVLRGASANMDEFGQSMEFLAALAEEFGLGMRTLQEGFAGFLAAGRQAGLTMGSIEESFRGLSVAAAAFQVSGVELELMLLGARQLMGSATVNMEDLRQVTERIPGAMGAAVDAVQEMTGDLDLNAQSMRDLVAQGKVATDEFFPLFTKRLEEMNLKGAAENTDSFVASINRLNNAFDDVKRALVDAGVLDALASLLKLFTELTVEATAFWRAVGSGASFDAAIARMSGVVEASSETLEISAEIVDLQENIRRRQLDIIKGSGGADVVAENKAAVENMQKRLEAVRAEKDFAIEAQQVFAQMDAFNAPSGTPDIGPTVDGGDGAGAASAGARGGGGGRARTGGGGRRAVAAVKDYTEAIRNLREEFDPALRIQREFGETLALIGAANPADKLDLAAKATARMKEEMAGLVVETETLSDVVASDMSGAFASAFDEAIFGGEKFSAVVQGLEQDIISMISRLLVLKPLEEGLTGLLGGVGAGGGGVGSLFGAASAWFKGLFTPMADGGSFRAGQPLLIGERGPELMMPRRGGAIVPNENLGGVSVTVNFNAEVSGDGLRQSGQQIAAQVAAETQRALMRNG